jgi:hypothetical protein
MKAKQLSKVGKKCAPKKIEALSREREREREREKAAAAIFASALGIKVFIHFLEKDNYKL